MRKIIVTMWISLDGFISGPNNDMSFVGELFDEAMGRYETDVLSSADTLLMGRETYQSFAGSWPNVPNNPEASQGEIEYANILNAMHKIVFSKTLESADWNNSTLEREIVSEEIEKLKNGEGRDLLIYGSASIVQALTRLGLIDEYQLLIHPVALGSGKSLFGDNKVKLKLTNTKTHPSGVVIHYYEPAEK